MEAPRQDSETAKESARMQMSIINDHAGVNRAIHALRQHKPAQSNGRPICHECYCDLGNPPGPTVVTCKGCGETNYIEDNGK
jgi:hypothetical protein